MNKMIALAKKHRELIVYGIFGVFTTLVDFLSYYALANFWGIEENLSNIISQVTAIIFAFITNKLFVFEDKKSGLKEVGLQFATFFSMRLVSLLTNSSLFWLLLDVLHVNDLISKALVSVIVVILNYIFSKFLVFKKTKRGG